MMIRLRPDAVQAIVSWTAAYSVGTRTLLSEMGVALLHAGLSILSNGMDDEQVRAMIEQSFENTAPLRRETEARWKRTGFDRGTPS